MQTSDLHTYVLSLNEQSYLHVPINTHIHTERVYLLGGESCPFILSLRSLCLVHIVVMMRSFPLMAVITVTKERGGSGLCLFHWCGHG